MTHELWASLNAHIFSYPELGNAGRPRPPAAAAEVSTSSPHDHRGPRRRRAKPRGRGRRLTIVGATRATPSRMHEDTDLPRLLGDDAGRSARRAEDDSVPDRAFRQPGVALAFVRLGGRAGGRGGARARRGAGQLRSEGARVDVGRDRVDQPRAQGRRALLQGQGQAPRHGQDRAQGDARHDARARARRLRGHVSRRDGRTACSTWTRSRLRCGPTRASCR